MGPVAIVADGVKTGEVVQPTCTVLPITGQILCGEEGLADLRDVMSVCPSIAAYYGGIYQPDTPFLVLDTAVDSGCEEALLFFVPI